MTVLRGVHVGVLGLDGVDKGPIVTALESALHQHGVSTRRISWQRYLSELGPDPDGYPGADLDAAWADVFRIFFGGATVDGESVAPASYQETLSSGIMHRLRTATVSAMRPASPLATAWIEVAAHTILHEGVVLPSLSEGHVVIQESLGFKNLIKSLLMAEYLDPANCNEFVEMRRFAHGYFGTSLAADLGVYVYGDPEVLLARSGDGGMSAFDSFQLLGGDAHDTYLQLQSGCAVEFDRFARVHGWQIIDGTDPSAQPMSDLAEKVLERLQPTEA